MLLGAICGTVLLVDDDEASTASLVGALNKRQVGFRIEVANSAREAIELQAKLKPEVIVCDLTLDEVEGPESGLRLVSELLVSDLTLRIIVLTGQEASTYGLRALEQGAASFLEKPVNVPHLLELLRDGINTAQLRRKFGELSRTERTATEALGISSRSPAMIETLTQALYAASNLQSVLLCGETGTGKGVLARAIHSASTRGSAPFIRLQPRFGSSDIVSSEIFGHERGAFTGAVEKRRGLLAEAHGGTFFIDEVDELPQETQILLLNTLQERTYRSLGSNKDQSSNFRLIAATNRPLSEVIGKKLREDFYHRISHLTLEIPPLRDRPEDLELLSSGILQSLIERERLSVQSIRAEAWARLRGYDFPGNVRELQAIVEGAAYRAQFDRRSFVEAKDITLPKRSAKHVEGDFWEQVRAFQLRLIQDALLRHGNNQTRAAQSLKLDRTTMRRLIKEGL